MPKVSVIIPTFNSARYLREAVDSALGQTARDLEIIIIDDGSTDATCAIAEDYARRHAAQVRFVCQANRGPAAARNAAIALAGGEYIAFLDSDDIWLPGKLERQLCFLESNPAVGLVACTWQEIDEEGKPVASAKKRGSLTGVRRQLFTRNAVGTCSAVVVRKKALDETGLFDETLQVGEDWDLWLRISHRYPIEIMPQPLLSYRVRINSQSYFGAKNLDNDIRFLDKMFSQPPMRRRWLLKSRTYSYKYFAAAWAFFSQNDAVQARRCLTRSE